MTYSGCSAKIDQDLALLEEAILLIQLNKLEGGTGTITLLFCKLIPFIQTAFAMFLLDRHGSGVKIKGEGKSTVWKRLGLQKTTNSEASKNAPRNQKFCDRLADKTQSRGDKEIMTVYQHSRSAPVDPVPSGFSCTCQVPLTGLTFIPFGWWHACMIPEPPTQTYIECSNDESELSHFSGQFNGPKHNPNPRSITRARL